MNTTALSPAGSACSRTLALPAVAAAEAVGVKTRDPVCAWAPARVSPPPRLTHPHKWVKHPQPIRLSHTVSDNVALFHCDRLKDGRELFCRLLGVGF